jgi:hypothetical protein
MLASTRFPGLGRCSRILSPQPKASNPLGLAASLKIERFNNLLRVEMSLTIWEMYLIYGDFSYPSDGLSP